MRNLVRISVEHLLGRFDHEVSFPGDWKFVILHGPNGVGKTKLLQLVDSVFSLNLSAIHSTPFRLAQFIFDDNCVLTVTRRSQDENGDYSGFAAGSVSLQLELADGQEYSWDGEQMSDEVLMRLRRYIEREVPLRRRPNGSWMDVRRGDHLDLRGIINRYRHMLPTAFIDDVAKVDPPEAIREFCDGINVHLIDTQRLTTELNEDIRRPDREAGTKPTVVRYAEELRARLQRELASNSRTTQQLDRTFPRRVLEGIVPDDINDGVIRERFQEQSDLRTRLSQISLLEDRVDLPLPDRNLEDWERRVLWTYLEDTAKKLATFEQLVVRVDALREIIGSRFLYKEIVIDSDEGFRIVTDNGTPVPAASLSSGEQHELILIYDLLFNAPQHGLILIDEPEISLHVAWQQKFLEDMAKISEISSLRFIVATHSPQIIHKWWSRTSQLSANTRGDVAHA